MRKSVLLAAFILIVLLIPCRSSADFSACIYLNSDFEYDSEASQPSGFQTNPKGNTNRVCVENVGGSYGNVLQITKNDTEGDPYAEVDLSGYSIDKAVLEFAFCTPNYNADKILTFRTKNAKFNELIRLRTNGTITVGGQAVCCYEKNRWYSVAVIISYKEKKLMVYIDGVQKGSVVCNEDWVSDSPGFLRAQILPGTEDIFCLDQIRMYSDNIILSDWDKNLSTVPMIASEESIAQKLNGCIAVIENETKAYCNGEKLILNYAPKQINQKLYLAVADAAALFELEQAWLQDNQILMDGVYRIAAETIEQKTGKKLFYSKKYGTMVFSSENTELTQTDLKTVFDFVFYTRPTQSRILKDFVPMQNVHPRIMATAETFSQIRSRIQTDKTMKAWYASVLQESDIILTQTHTYYYKPDGLRLLDMSRQLLYRAYTLSMAYQLSGNTAYAEYIREELIAVCDFPDWNSRTHFLDTAEMTAGVAIAYDWCYDYLSPSDRVSIENAIVRLGLEAGKCCYSGIYGYSNQWIGWDNNWNEVCNSGLTLGALAVMDQYPQLCSKLLESAFSSMEAMLGEFSPDGAWAEGTDYWAYAVSYLVYQSAALGTVLGTDYGYFDMYGIRNTGYFSTYMQSAQGSFNIGDAWHSNFGTAGVFYLANKFQDSELTALRLKDMQAYRMQPTALDLLWYSPQEEAETAFPYDKFFRDTEIVTMRSAFDCDTALFVGMHAGDNLINHGNLDSGTFVLDALGIRWAQELGSDDYNLSGYFDNVGGRRYNYYRCGAQGQNTIALDPTTTQGQEKTAVTEFCKFETSPRGAFAVIDMKNAFGTKVNSAYRGIKLEENRTRVLLRDELDLQQKSDLWWFMHTKASIEILADGKIAVLTQEGKQMIAKLSSNLPTAVFSVQAAAPFVGDDNPEGQADNSAWQKLCVHLDQAIGSVNISVLFLPVTEWVSEEEKNAAFTDISDLGTWKNDSGTIAALSQCFYNGNKIGGFTPDHFSYTVTMPSGVWKAPLVTATAAQNMTMVITQPSKIGDCADIKVYDKENPENCSNYKIWFQWPASVWEKIQESFENYSSTENFVQNNTATATLNGVYPQTDTAFSLENGKNRFLEDTTYFVLKSASGANSALITKPVCLTKRTKLSYDIRLNSLSQTVAVIFREGTAPNWIYPFYKAETTANPSFFGKTVAFAMQENTWYHFDFDLFFDTENRLLTFSVKINGNCILENAMVNLASYTGMDVKMESVTVKFYQETTGIDAQVFWDNIDLHPVGNQVNKIALFTGDKKIHAMSEASVGESIRILADAEYLQGKEVLLCIAARQGQSFSVLHIEKISSEVFSKGEMWIATDPIMQAYDTIKVFIIDATSLRPIL